MIGECRCTGYHNSDYNHVKSVLKAAGGAA